MLDIYCYLLSPIHIQDSIKSMISPIIYSGKIYVIRDKKLYNILSAIGLLQDFIKTTREKGYEYTTKWLSSKSLLNQGFLENASQYWIENINIKKINDYRVFLKDLNSNPVISSEHIINLFKKSLIYKYIQDRRILFNIFLERELQIIEKELSQITDISKFCSRQDYYRKNLFKQIMENFLTDVEEELILNFNNLDNLNVKIETHLNMDDLKLYKICNLDNYKNFKFKISKVSQKECLKEHTIIKLNLLFSRSASSGKNFSEYVDYLFDNIQHITQDKLNFDKQYINQLITNGSTARLTEIVHSIKNINNLSKLFINHKSHTSSDENTSDLIDYKILMLQINHIMSSYDSINNSNFIVYSDDELDRLVCILNTEKQNIEKINSLILDKNEKIESKVVKFSTQNNSLTYLPYGFACVNY